MPVKIRGLKGLDKALKELPERVAKKHLGRAVGKGAQLVRTDAKRRAPVNDEAFGRYEIGRLQRNVFYFKLRKRNTRHSVSYGVSVRTKGNKDAPTNAYYWTFVEFGTVYQIAQPFLRPAFEANKREAVAVIGKELGRRIQEEARKLYVTS